MKWLDRFPMMFAAAVLLAAAVYGLVWMTLDWLLDRYGDDPITDPELLAEIRASEEREKRIVALPVGMARRHVERLFDVGERFRAEPDARSERDAVFDEVLDLLSPLTKEFFERYGRVTVNGLFGPSVAGPGCFHRTRDANVFVIGGSEDNSTFVRLGDDTVYFDPFYGSDKVEECAPSIYHWLLMEYNKGVLCDSVTDPELEADL